MAFENLTLFELHLENARIGPSFGDDGADGPAQAHGSGGGGRRLGLAVAGLLLLAGGAAAARKVRRGGGDGGRITIEQAAEQ